LKLMCLESNVLRNVWIVQIMTCICQISCFELNHSQHSTFSFFLWNQLLQASSLYFLVYFIPNSVFPIPPRPEIVVDWLITVVFAVSLLLLEMPLILSLCPWRTWPFLRPQNQIDFNWNTQRLETFSRIYEQSM
jgi:hypothetical protein